MRSYMYNHHHKVFLLVVVLACYILTAGKSYGQVIHRIHVSSGGCANEKVKEIQVKQWKDTAMKINARILDFKAEPNARKLNVLSNSLLNISFLKSLPNGEKIKRNIDSVLNTSNLNFTGMTPLDTIPVANIGQADSTKTTDSTGSTTLASTNCGGFETLSDLVEEKQDDGSFLFSFLDKNDNPLKTFVLKQFNEELFYKKVSDGVYSICTNTPDHEDSLKGEVLIKEFKSQNLYQRFLEATAQADNSQDLAGKLKIFKYTVCTRKTDTSDGKQKDTSKRASQPINADRYQRNDQHVARFVPDNRTNNLMYNLAANNLYHTASYITSPKINPVESPGYEITRDAPYEAPVDSLAGTLRGKYVDYPFTVYSIQIQFQDGFIENIKIYGKRRNDPRLLKFENFYPIPFSTKRNFKKLAEICLYENSFNDTKPLYILLGDVISYNQTLAIDNKDYSPANQVYTNEKITDSTTDVNLYKEQTSKILEMKVFSDLQGVNIDNPNGLIQFEVSKKLNFWSRRVPIIGTGKFINYGFLNHITPLVSLNKIEKNHKSLVLNYIDTASATNNPGYPITFTSTINLLMHQNFTIGLDLSAILIDIPAVKSTFNFGPIAYFGNTPVQDTFRVKDTARSVFVPTASNNVNGYNVNTFQYGIYGSWQIFPSPKWGISITERIFDFDLLSSRFLQIRDSSHYINFITSLQGDRSKYNSYSFHKTLASTEIFAFFFPSRNSKVFFRYRLTHDFNNSKEVYHQVQLGFATTITWTKEISKAKTSDTPNL